MSKCYNCEDELTLINSSEEHIILNSIGGRLKSKRLLCKGCNSLFGSECDIELAKQLLFFTSHLQVKKNRGKIGVIKGGKTADGEFYDIVEGSKPVISKPVCEINKDGNQVTIHAQARSVSEMRHILEGIARKYPGFNVDEAMDTAIHRKEYLDKPIEYQEKI